MRLFVAVLVPPRVRRSLQAAVRGVAGGHLRWVPPQQWHVTLRFVGEVDDVAAVGGALRSVPGALQQAGEAPVVARLGPATGWMANGRVLQVPVVGLDALAAAVADAVVPWAPPADHPFLGHLTLARSRSGGGPGAGLPVTGTWRVDRIALVASTLGPAGAIHRVVRRVEVRRAGSTPPEDPCTNTCS